MKINLKTKFLLFLIIFFGIFGLAKSSLAATNHYIRAGASGTTCADWGTNACNALPATLTRGDAYYIADGNYGSYIFDDPVSGTSAITIKKATASDHGTGTGWVSTYGDGQAVFAARLIFHTDYWVFNGVTGGGPGSWDSCHGFRVNTTSDMEGMVIIGWKYYGPTFHPVSHITLSHVEFTSGTSWSNPLDLGSGTNNTVSSYLTLEYLYFNDCWRGTIQAAAATDSTIQYSYFKGGRVDVNHHFMNIRMDKNYRISIRYNVFEDFVSTGSIGSYGTTSDISVYGNVFKNTTGHVANAAKVIYTNSHDAVSATNWKIYNNSFVNIYDPAYVIYLADAIVSGNVLYNNIFYNTNGTPARIGVTPDYNWYYPSISHGEAHGQVGTGDPFIDWTTGNFRLSTATAAGYSFSSPYTADPYEVVRGIDGNWDRGAYEYVSGGDDTTPPASPTGLSVQ